MVRGTCFVTARVSPAAKMKIKKMKLAVISRNFLFISVSKNGKKCN
jgi:hypothetical protein